MTLQTKWRIAGGVALGCAAVLALYGAEGAFPRQSPLAFFVYWGLFLACLLIAVFIAIVDWRYIKLQYAVAQREILRETMKDRELKKALRSRATLDPQPDSDDDDNQEAGGNSGDGKPGGA